MKKLFLFLMAALMAVSANAQTPPFEVGTYNLLTGQFTNQTVNINGSFTFAIKVNAPNFQTVLNATSATPNATRTLAYFEARYVLENGDPDNPTYLGDRNAQEKPLSLEARMTRVPGQFIYYAENYTPDVNLPAGTTGMIHFNVLVAEHDGDFWWTESNAAGATPGYAGGIPFAVPDNGGGGGGEIGVIGGNKGNTKYLMHYMPWFVKPDGNFPGWSGQWNHWTGNGVNPANKITINGKQYSDIFSYYHPLIDIYNSNDRDVIEYHCLLMKYAGIDGVMPNWYGSRDVWDYAVSRNSVDVLAQVAQEVGLEFAVNYEDNTAGQGGGDRIANAQADMNYLKNNYFGKSNHIKINGKPLVSIFGPRLITDNGSWNTIFSVLNPKPYFVPHVDMVPGGLTMHDALLNWTSREDDTYRYDIQRLKGKNSTMFIASVHPGFRDCYNGKGNAPQIDYATVDHANGTFLRNRLNLAKYYSPPYIQLATWNDFTEGTMFEPTEEFQYLFLNILQESLDLSHYKYVLPEIKRYFDQKKQYKGNPTEEARLKRVFDYFVAVNPDAAIALLNGQEPCTQYTVTFSSDGGSAVASQTKCSGESIATSPVTNRANYVFDGWFDGATKVIFPYTITKNVTLTAHWTCVKNTVTFNSDGGSAVAAQTDCSGFVISTAPSTNRSGFTLDGWYNGAIKINFPYTVNASVILTAHWSQTGTSIIDNEATATKPKITGYYTIVGQKLSQEPEKGLYIILYDNGKAEKKIK